MQKVSKYVALVTVFVILASCENSYTPKPRGYFRIELPEKAYQKSDSSLPYIFEFPAYANMGIDRQSPQENYWRNINFPYFNATLHLSYKTIDQNLFEYLEDSYTLVSKHIPKADAITDSVVYDQTRQVYGLIYRIEGSATATPFQFFVTDSTHHFLRGALYFNTTPNNDSLEPVIRFLEKDMLHLIETLQWNNALADNP